MCFDRLSLVAVLCRISSIVGFPNRSLISLKSRPHNGGRWSGVAWLQEIADVEICVQIGANIHLFLIALKDEFPFGGQIVDDLAAEPFGKLLNLFFRQIRVAPGLPLFHLL